MNGGSTRWRPDAPTPATGPISVNAAPGTRPRHADHREGERRGGGRVNLYRRMYVARIAPVSRGLAVVDAEWGTVSERFDRDAFIGQDATRVPVIAVRKW